MCRSLFLPTPRALRARPLPSAVLARYARCGRTREGNRWAVGSRVVRRWPGLLQAQRGAPRAAPGLGPGATAACHVEHAARGCARFSAGFRFGSAACHAACAWGASAPARLAARRLHAPARLSNTSPTFSIARHRDARCADGSSPSPARALLRSTLPMRHPRCRTNSFSVTPVQHLKAR